jgi:hypothetical protein
MRTSKLISDNGSELPTKGSATPEKRTHGEPAQSQGKKATKRATQEKAMPANARRKATIGGSKSEKLICRYCGSSDLAPSFIKRRDRRCRKCFSKRYGSTAPAKKTKGKK